MQNFAATVHQYLFCKWMQIEKTIPHFIRRIQSKFFLLKSTEKSLTVSWMPNYNLIVLSPIEVIVKYSTECWIIYYLSDWWYTYPSEKYEFVSWDDDIPKMMGKS